MTLPSESELFLDDNEISNVPVGNEYELIRDAAAQLYYTGDFGDWITNVMEDYGWSRIKAERFLSLYEGRITRQLRRLERLEV